MVCLDGWAEKGPRHKLNPPPSAHTQPRWTAVTLPGERYPAMPRSWNHQGGGLDFWDFRRLGGGLLFRVLGWAIGGGYCFGVWVKDNGNSPGPFRPVAASAWPWGT